MPQFTQKNKDQALSMPSTELPREDYWITVLLYFASFLIGLGIISLIAANWQNIPNNLKLLGGCGLMMLNALALIWALERKKDLLKQVIACIYAFLIMGIIGLIGQVFQLQTNAMSGCLLWSLVSWPLFLVAPRLLWLWIPLYFYGIGYLPDIWKEAIEGSVFGWKTGTNQYNISAFDLYRSLSVMGLLIAYELWVNLNKSSTLYITNTLRFFAGLIVLCTYSNLAVFNPLIMKDIVNGQANGTIYIAILSPYLVMAVVFWLFNNWRKRRSFMPFFMAGLGFQLIWLWSPYTDKEIEKVLPFIFCLCFLGYAYDRQVPRLLKLAVLAMFIWFCGVFGEDIFDLIPSLILCTVITLIAYRARHRKWFNTGIILAVFRILAYYADVENLQYMGLYLIGAGILLITTLLFLTKYNPLKEEKKNEK